MTTGLEACIEAELEAHARGELSMNDIEWIEGYMLTGHRSGAQRFAEDLGAGEKLSSTEKKHAQTRFHKLWPWVKARLAAKSEMYAANREEIEVALTQHMRFGENGQVQIRAAQTLAKIRGLITNVVEVDMNEEAAQRLADIMRSGRRASRADQSG